MKFIIAYSVGPTKRYCTVRSVAGGEILKGPDPVALNASQHLTFYYTVPSFHNGDDNSSTNANRFSTLLKLRISLCLVGRAGGGCMQKEIDVNSSTTTSNHEERICFRVQAFHAPSLMPSLPLSEMDSSVRDNSRLYSWHFAANFDDDAERSSSDGAKKKEGEMCIEFAGVDKSC